MTFIVFEGIDGSGKSTLLEAVRQRYVAGGQDPLCLREPGSTALGERVREALLDPRVGRIHAWTEVCLFTACRAEMVATRIVPALSQHQPVLLDRYFYSTLAYQGGGEGADPDAILSLNLEATGHTLPDLVIFPDLNPQAAAQRRGGDPDRMEAKGLAFATEVRRSFLAQAAAHPELWLVLDAEKSPLELAQETTDALIQRGLMGRVPPSQS